MESGASGQSTNLLTEGNSGSAGEAVALVNPATGEYIVFNMSSAPPSPPQIQNKTGFPGTTNVGTVDGHAAMEDQWAGNSYRYNANTGSYESPAVSVPCFVSGSLIATPSGEVPVKLLKVGDPVLTRDSGPQPIRWVGLRILTRSHISRTGQHPIEFAPGSFGSGLPRRKLRVSPQHRMLIENRGLAPAKGLTGLPKVRVMSGCQGVRYHHILLGKHEVIYAEGAQTESLLPGRVFLSWCRIPDRLTTMRIAGPSIEPERPCLSVAESRWFVARQSDCHLA